MIKRLPFFIFDITAYLFFLGTEVEAIVTFTG